MTKTSRFKFSIAGVVQYSSLTKENPIAPDSVINLTVCGYRGA